MARQHIFGIGWLSKPGKMEDVLHKKLADLEGAMSIAAFEYGKVVLILKRSWWSAMVKLCILRCLWHAFDFWIYRLDKDWEIVRED